MTDPTGTETVAWNDWLRRWDAQQEVYIEARERRFGGSKPTFGIPRGWTHWVRTASMR
ncbi:MAG: hypothetical protein ACRDS1_07595 [Pseudonocardiaceae bacterium]